MPMMTFEASRSSLWFRSKVSGDKSAPFVALSYDIYLEAGIISVNFKFRGKKGLSFKN